MSGFSKMMLVVLTFGLSTSLSADLYPREIDVTKRAKIGDKMFSTKMYDMKMNEGLMDKRFPVKTWQGGTSPIGDRRADIDVGESRDKEIIRPGVIEMEKRERKMAPINGRKAFLRNFDRVREKRLVPAYSEEATVVHVKDASVPAPSEKQPNETSMRDINRFTFQRNHSDASGLKVEKAASEEKE